ASAPAELHPVWPNRLGRVGSRRVLRSKGAFRESRARSLRRSAEGLGNPTVAHRDRRRGTAACWPAVPVAADGLADRRACHRPHRHRRQAEAEDNPAEDNSPLEDKPEMAGRAEQAGSTAREPSLPTPRRRSLVPRWQAHSRRELTECSSASQAEPRSSTLSSKKIPWRRVLIGAK